MFVHILLAPSVVSKAHKKLFKFFYLFTYVRFGLKHLQKTNDEINNKNIFFQNGLIYAVKEYSQILIFERTLTTKKK